MKKIIPFVLFAFLAMNTTSVLADNTDSKKATSSLVLKAKVSTLSDEEIKCRMERLVEIRDMDKSNLTASDKRELRKEVRGIRDELKNTAAKSGTTIIVIPLVTVLIVILILLLI